MQPAVQRILFHPSRLGPGCEEELDFRVDGLDVPEHFEELGFVFDAEQSEVCVWAAVDWYTRQKWSEWHWKEEGRGAAK